MNSFYRKPVVSSYNMTAHDEKNKIKIKIKAKEWKSGNGNTW
jgi:hypothetical protein